MCNYVLYLDINATSSSALVNSSLMNAPTPIHTTTNALSVIQEMQCNTDHLVKHQVEMQEMRKLIHFQQEQYKLTSRLFR